MYLIFTSISQRLDIVLQLLESQVVSKRPSFGLQKVAFYNAKDGLSQREKPSFRKRQAMCHWAKSDFFLHTVLYPVR